ncbi:Uu.00g070660.m01.CDS01 [Anthostomella pinea]|uniref:Uu.00g070660.m01.CDS01 n=1 Tax=Anthostomella pinea TaxID=933095 RepID=A0AAI8VP44_9PEZI|nr:Uu.00g070660.m01.CDS01 [Anthostomella pinea]
MATAEMLPPTWSSTDDDSLRLILDLLAADVSAITSSSKGKQPKGQLSDEELALQLYAEEVEGAAVFASDRRMTRSIQSAVQTDADALTQSEREERMAQNDHDISASLSRGMPETGVEHAAVENPSEADMEIWEKLSALYITGIDDCTDEEPDTEEVDAGLPGQPECSSWAATRQSKKVAQRRPCQACRDPKHFTDLARAPCNHEYCRACLAHLFQDSMLDETLFPPRCCKQPIYTGEEQTISHGAFGPAHAGDCPQDGALQAVLDVAREERWQRCYKCFTMIELNMGCFHMTTSSVEGLDEYTEHHYMLQSMGKEHQADKLGIDGAELVTTASPRVGNQRLIGGLIQRIPHIIRVTSDTDIVPASPPGKGWVHTPVEVSTKRNEDVKTKLEAGLCSDFRGNPPPPNQRVKVKCAATSHTARAAARSATGRSTRSAAPALSTTTLLPVPVPQPKAIRVPVQGLEKAVIAGPFSHLDQGTYLYDRPEQDVYKLLIDCYRLRMDDNLKFDRVLEPDSIYQQHVSSGLPGFRRFVRMAQAILPPWWSEEKQKECEASATGWSDLDVKIQKADIIRCYGDDHFPMQLRFLAEAVYGSGPGGQDGTFMREHMMERERGEFDGTVVYVDTSARRPEE